MVAYDYSMKIEDCFVKPGNVQGIHLKGNSTHN
jgi:hypothetical protein